MPYINKDEREYFKDIDSRKFSVGTPGQLNYLITKLVHRYLIDRGDLRYTTINEVIGVLECAKLEVYRMIAAPYENVKQEENGPISELDK